MCCSRVDSELVDKSNPVETYPREIRFLTLHFSNSVKLIHFALVKQHISNSLTTLDRLTKLKHKDCYQNIIPLSDSLLYSQDNIW